MESVTNAVENIRTTAVSLHRYTNLSEWIQFGIIVVIGLLVVWLVNRFGIRLLVNVLKKKQIPAAYAIGGAISAPLCLVMVVFFLNTAKSVFKHMPGWLWQRVEHLAVWIYGFAVVVFLFRLVDIILSLLQRKWQQADRELNAQMIRLLGQTSKGLILLVALIMILDQAGIKVLGLITGLGFLGAAVALAAQNTLANLIGSVEILADRLFQVGDRITFSDYDGFVTRMGLRSVELTSLYGVRINLPNKDLVDKQIRNLSRGRYVHANIRVGITYDCSRQKIEQAMKLLEEVLEEAKRRLDFPEVESYVTNFRQMADYFLEIEIVFWAVYTTGREYWSMMTPLHLAIKEKFDAAGIPFAFPTQTLHIESLKK
jgi:MscS family membrane protein